MNSYPIPAAAIRVEHEVSHSRFITSLAPAPSVEEARAYIAAVRAEMPDATHHVYAFKVGYKTSVIEGLSDDGEPTGTAGPPVMAVLRGAELGDAVLVVTRYFGGTQLGTGGLVRAYSDSARAALAAVVRIDKVAHCKIALTVPYPLYERIKLLTVEYNADIDDEAFLVNVTLKLTLPADALDAFTSAVRNMSAGRVTPMVLES
jgi:uncharacterized YigZ family protein